jgi:hypothetical protein
MEVKRVITLGWEWGRASTRRSFKGCPGDAGVLWFLIWSELERHVCFEKFHADFEISLNCALVICMLFCIYSLHFNKVCNLSDNCIRKIKN